MNLNDEIIKLLKDNRKISAIKLYRESTGASLGESKKYVEKIQTDFDIKVEFAYELRAESLLEKHGFCDGDIFESELNEYWDDCEKRGIQYEMGMLSKTLIATVKKYLLPMIPFDVECVEWRSMHNPIRLTKIDGEEIGEHNYKMMRELLRDEKVKVSKDQVREMIREITGNP